MVYKRMDFEKCEKVAAGQGQPGDCPKTQGGTSRSNLNRDCPRAVPVVGSYKNTKMVVNYGE